MANVNFEGQAAPFERYTSGFFSIEIDHRAAAEELRSDNTHPHRAHRKRRRNGA